MERLITSVTLQVTDLQRSLKFYAESMGFRILEQNDSTAHLGVPGHDDALVTLVANPEARRKPPRTTGLYHMAVLFPNRRALASVLRRLSLARWPFQGFSDHDVSEALYLADPDGNGIELYADRPKESWKVVNGEVQMGTVALDVDDLLSEIESTPIEDDPPELPEGTIIGHIHLHVRDLESAEAFYVDLLGFDAVLRSYPGALFVSSHGYHHHVGLNVWAGIGAPAPPDDAVGLLSFTLRPPNDRDPTAIVEGLKQAGYEVQEGEAGWVTKDPQGIEIVLLRSA